MNNDNVFPLSLDFEGKHYKGTIEPSVEKGPNGQPIYFRVAIDGELFAYLCCGDNGWNDRDNSGKSGGLISAIGEYIFDYYE